QLHAHSNRRHTERGADAVTAALRARLNVLGPSRCERRRQRRDGLPQRRTRRQGHRRHPLARRGDALQRGRQPSIPGGTDRRTKLDGHRRRALYRSRAVGPNLCSPRAVIPIDLLLDLVRGLTASTPPPRGLPYLGLEHASGTGFHLLDALSARGIFRKYELVLDVGAGLGGRARWLATRFGCEVVGATLTVEEAAGGTQLGRRSGLRAQVRLLPAAPRWRPSAGRSAARSRRACCASCSSSPGGRRRPAGRSVLVDRVAELRPPPPAAVHRDRPAVAHLLERIGGERRAEAAPAVEDDLGLAIRDALLDVALDDALREVPRAAGVALLPLAILAHVDQVEALARLLAAAHL